VSGDGWYLVSVSGELALKGWPLRIFPQDLLATSQLLCIYYIYINASAAGDDELSDRMDFPS
jgi:hypothetical protein